MKTKARFIGADGSMGLRHGRVYDIYVSTGGNIIAVKMPGFYCPYGSMKALLKNWDFDVR